MTHPLRLIFIRATYAFSGTLVGRLAAAAAGIIIARSLQAELFGVYSALWELALLCGSFTDTGMTVGLQRDGSRDRSKLGGLLGNALLVRVAIGFPALAVAWFFSTGMTGGKSYPAVYCFLALASATVFLAEPMYCVLQVLGRQRGVAIIESLRGILSLAAIALMVALHRGVVAMALMQAAVYLAMFAWLTIVTFRTTRLSFNFRETVEQFKGSFVYGISGLVFSVYSRIPLFYLSWLKGPVAVGYYAAAYRIVSVLYVVGAGAYQRAFLPSLFGLHRSDPAAFRDAGDFMQKYFFLSGFLCAIALYAGADTMIVLLMGKIYLPSIAIMRIFSLSVLLNYLLYAGDASMTAADRNYVKLLFQVIGTAAGLLAGYFLVAGAGAAGAVITDNIIRGTQMLLFLGFCYSRGYLSFSAIMRFAPAALLILAAAILSVIIFPDAIILRPLLLLIAAGAIVTALLGPSYLKNLFGSYLTLKKEPPTP